MRARDAQLDIQSSLQIPLSIVYGLNHVHEEYYTHGGMKPHNVFLTSEFNLVIQQDRTSIATFAPFARANIAYFGLSKRLTSSINFRLNPTTIVFSSVHCGTYLFMSPEAYNGVNSFSYIEAKASDVYYFGLILFKLFLDCYYRYWKELKNRFNYINLSVLVKDLDGDHDNMNFIHDILNWYHNVGLMIQGIVLQYNMFVKL